jgi:soluble lytic murein transglycosylase-like protein
MANLTLPAALLLLWMSCPIVVQADQDQARIESCIVSAAKYRHQDPKLLKAIALQESGMNPSLVSGRNKNGTVDIGLFQINSGWLPKLKKLGITERQLYDGCVSAYVGAWILAHEVNTHGATWRAVGAYNSPTESIRKIYAQSVHQRYMKLLGDK